MIFLNKNKIPLKKTYRIEYRSSNFPQCYTANHPQKNKRNESL